MRKIRLNIELLLDDDVANEVESMDNLSLELAAYFTMKHNGGVLFTPDSLTDIINDVLDDYEDEEEPVEEAVLTDKDTAKIEDIIATTLNKVLSTVVVNVQTDNTEVIMTEDTSEENGESSSEVLEFDSVEIFGTMSDSDDESDEDNSEGFDELADMFGF